jgi:ketosteroid isomerase-like protein
VSARFLVSALAVLIAGCATVQEVEPPKPVVPTPTCKGAADCEVKWSAARTYLIDHAAYKLQNDSVDRLETYNPNEDSSAGLRAQVSRAIQPDGSYAIVAKFWCNNLFECSPSASRTLNDFNSTIAATGSANVPPQGAMTSPPPVVADRHEDKVVDNSPQVDAETYIKDGEAAWARSMSADDASVVQRLLADDCVWISNGKAIDKAAAIAAASRGSIGLVSNHLDHATVRLFGDTAVVQRSDTWSRKDGTTGRTVWTDTWIRRNRQWQIVAAQSTVTPMQ